MAKYVMLLAASLNNVIGFEDGNLPWHIPSDLARFKKLTLGKTLVMGRKTFESLPVKLKDRNICVLSSTMSQKDHMYGENVTVIRDLSQINSLTNDDIFICGGSKVYEEMYKKCIYVMLTRVHTVVNKSDSVYFNRLSEISTKWRISNVDFPLNTDKDEFPTTYITYRNISK
jgi:dihydrofolate reductase